MATKGIHQFLIALIAQLASNLTPVGISRPAAVETDDRDHRKIMPHCSVHLHGVHAERPIAMEHQHRFIRLGSFCTYTEGYANSHGTKWTRIKTMPSRGKKSRTSLHRRSGWMGTASECMKGSRRA